jgi:hypothetical protein
MVSFIFAITNALTPDEIAARLKSFPHDQYLYVGGFMRSIALAAGTIVLLEIFGNWRKYRWLLFPWIATLLACLVTITTWGRGVLLANSPANILDAVLPMLIGIVEVCMFTILSPRILLQRESDTTSDGVLPPRSFRHWAYWFVFSAMHAFLAVFLVWNRMSLTHVDLDFSADLRSLGLEYVGWMKGDVIGASVGTVLSAVSACILLRKKKNTLRWSVALTLIPIVVFVCVSVQADHQRSRTNDVIFAQDHK